MLNEIEIQIEIGNQKIKSKSNWQTVNELKENGIKVKILKPKKENEK